MATEKKAKSKGKTRKKSRKAPKRVPSRKPATRKTAAKKAKPAKPRAPVKPRPKPLPTPKPEVATAPSAPAAIPPPGEERIGIVTHYYSHLMVASVTLETGTLRVGETVHILGHTSDFRQAVESMELEHVPVTKVRAPQSFGLRVKERAREHDVVYKVRA